MWLQKNGRHSWRFKGKPFKKSKKLFPIHGVLLPTADGGLGTVDVTENRDEVAKAVYDVLHNKWAPNDHDRTALE